jgi:glycosyltransferase involved in cell wall biosynthesis
MAMTRDQSSPSQLVAVSRRRQLRGKRAAVVLFSYYPADPRPRRAAETLVSEGMRVELICLRESPAEASHEIVNGVDVRRVPLRRRRGGTLGYIVQYASFLLAALGILAARALTRQYHLVHVHNMPDILVLSALVPKVLGAKVILDLHDPMPELMVTIFGLDGASGRVRLLKALERWSIRWVDLVFTVNLACRRLFVSRSCPAEKIVVVMNAPDERIFGFRPVASERRARAAGTPFVIMYHGSLVERNGLDLLVDAVARVRQLDADVELRIYGAPTPYLAQVMESPAARDLGETVRCLGARRLEEIVEAIAQCDLGVIPNRRSQFSELNTPTRIFEYLALGKPVVAPRSAGILDYFDEDTLVLFELGDADDLARRILDVLADPDKASAIARRGQDVYRAHAWRRERRVLVDAVDALLGGGGATA